MWEPPPWQVFEQLMYELPHRQPLCSVAPPLLYSGVAPLLPYSGAGVRV